MKFNSKNLVGFASAIGLLLASSSSFAAELLVTKGVAKGTGSRVSLDVVSEGDVSGFNFTVALGKVQASKADLSKCVSELPKGWSGECNLVNGKVIIIAMADRMTTLPAGAVSVGSIGFNTADMSKAQQAITIENMEFVDVKGNVLQATTTVE